MENDDIKKGQRQIGNESPSGAPDIQANADAEASKDANNKAAESKGKKWTLKQHWQRSSSAKRVKWIFEGIGGLIALLILANYVWQNLQTKWNFTTEHKPRIYLSGNVQAMVVRVAPDPDKRVYIIGFFPLMNFGNSPAMHFIGAGEVIPGYGPDLEKRADDWFSAIGLPLKKPFDPYVGMWIMENGIGELESTIMQGQREPFSIAQNKEISVSPKLPAVVVARVQYQDESGNLYWTDACYYLPLGFQATGAIPYPTPQCARHNEVH
jgi:hypothetical protein